MVYQKQKILLVTHQFTPHQSPRTTRWSLIVDELLRLGHKVTVVTGTKQEVQNKDIEIIYIGNKRSNNVVNNLREKSNNIDDKSKTKKVFFIFLKKIYRFSIKILAWPDYSMFWLLSVYRSRKNLILDYDLLISVSLPFSSHIAGYIINKKNKKDWIMDNGDPFTLKKDAPENNKILYGFLNKYFENKFYSLANKIVFTHQDSMDLHKDFFNISKDKLIVGNPISNFDNELFLKTLNFNYNSLPIKLGYFGIFTKGVRSPNNFLKLFKDVNDIELHWYTNQDSKDEIKVKNIKSKNIFNSIVSRDEALNLMSTSVHCLLSIGNLNIAQLPSKVIEYLSTGKPVVHFAEVHEDPVIKIANDFDNLFIITEMTDLESFFNELKLYFGKVSTFKKDFFIEKYSASSLIKTLNLS